MGDILERNQVACGNQLILESVLEEQIQVVKQIKESK
jgi:hypothetical protein